MTATQRKHARTADALIQGLASINAAHHGAYDTQRPKAMTPTVDDRLEAREALATRIDALARSVRANVTATEKDFEAAYGEVVTLAGIIRDIL